jgi:hypothetical protein
MTASASLYLHSRARDRTQRRAVFGIRDALVSHSEMQVIAPEILRTGGVRKAYRHRKIVFYQISRQKILLSAESTAD